MKEYRVMIGESDVFGLGGPVRQCGVIYSGWHEGDSPIITARGRVLLPCDEETYRNYMRQIKDYSVLHIRAEQEGSTFWAEEFVEVNATPTAREQDFLTQAALPTAFTDLQFGQFVQNKRLDFFEGKLHYLDEVIPITVEEPKDIETLRWICEDFETFRMRAAHYAAEKLLDLANDWCFEAWEGEDDDFAPMTVAEFVTRIQLSGISLSEEGAFSLWYDDDDIFWGHAVAVGGSKAQGITGASMQG